MAMAALIFDGVMEAFPHLRFGFLEAGAGWLPDFIENLHEHWRMRIADFDPDVQPSIGEFLQEFARERSASGDRGLIRKARQLMSVLSPGKGDRASPDELEAFRYEHPNLTRDPREYVERGQIFLTFEPGDPAAVYLPAAMGETAKRVCGMATDYGHWDADFRNCVSGVVENPQIDPEYAARLLSSNALAFYGERLRSRVCASSSVLADGARRAHA